VLHPDSGTNLQGRDANGFFVHGGDTPGSAGCVDLTGQNDAFHQFLKGYGKPIKLTVKLTCNPWKKSSNPPPGGGDAFGIGLGGGFSGNPFGGNWDIFDLLMLLYPPPEGERLA
jgi:hypothetical protein